jgi:hypothetical protein
MEMRYEAFPAPPIRPGAPGTPVFCSTRFFTRTVSTSLENAITLA